MGAYEASSAAARAVWRGLLAARADCPAKTVRRRRGGEQRGGGERALMYVHLAKCLDFAPIASAREICRTQRHSSSA